MRHRRGAAAIEFAMLLPVFLALLFGVIEFGWYFFLRSSLDSAVTLGCRAGSLVNPGEDDANLAAVQTRAEEVMAEVMEQGLSRPRDSSWTFAVETFGASPSRSLRCTASASFEPILGVYLDERIFSANQAVRLEWQ